MFGILPGLITRTLAFLELSVSWEGVIHQFKDSGTPGGALIAIETAAGPPAERMNGAYDEIPPIQTRLVPQDNR